MALFIGSYFSLLLPAFIFVNLLAACLRTESDVFKFISILIGMMFINTYCASLLVYFSSINLIAQDNLILAKISTRELILQPLVDVPTYSSSPFLFATLAVISAIFLRIKMPDLRKKILHFWDKQSPHFLKKFFIPFMPPFIFGILIKHNFDQTFGIIFKEYAGSLILIVSLMISYLFLMYLLAGNFSITKLFKLVRNMIPASLLAFSTSSSVSALPITIEGIKRNTKSSAVAEITAHFSVNFHLTGDTFTTPILALCTLNVFGHAMPTITEYLWFITCLAVSRFGGAGIPGGTILLTIVVLKSCLGFNTEMIATMFAVEFLFDAITTFGNVLGNGAFSILCSKTYEHISSSILPKPYVSKS